MARYTGPKDKISRRHGVAIFGPSKALDRRPYGPGQHGARSGRKKTSDYGIALSEKQKLRHQYGVLERQFRRIFGQAQRRKGVTGETLLQLLESRLDNVVYRMGLGITRNAARQFVSHGHIDVNGRKVNVSSRQLRSGDIVSVRENPRSKQLAIRALDLTQAAVVPGWLAFDKDKLSGTVHRLPSRDEIDPIVNEQLIVELYSR
ncbi:MAG: 30S ribosomal protein S4 [Verrucomicrobiales bacterium]